MDPKNPNKIIASMWEHKRDPWFFKSGGSWKWRLYYL